MLAAQICTVPYNFCLTKTLFIELLTSTLGAHLMNFVLAVVNTSGVIVDSKCDILIL